MRPTRSLALLLCAAGASAPARTQEPAPRASFDSAWAAIARSYWDTALVAGRWRAVHDSLRAALGPSPDQDRTRAAIRRLIAEPGQSHFVLIPESASPRTGGAPNGAAAGAAAMGTAGFDVRPAEGAMVVWRVEAGSPAAHAGLRPGDRIIALDTLRVASARAALRAAAEDAGRAERLLLALLRSRLGGPLDDSLVVHIARGGAGRVGAGRDRVLVVGRAVPAGRETRYGNLPPFMLTTEGRRVPVRRDASGGTIAIVRWSAWFPPIAPTLDSLLFAARDARGLVLDLRGNPGGVVGMIAGVSGHLLDTVVSLGELRSRSGVLRFAANPRVVDAAAARVGTYGGPVAVLVDEMSASTSEFFASGLQALGRARVFGTTSAGQALPATMTRLPNGDVLMHVIADHVDPRGARVEGHGVRPDVATPLRVTDLRRGRDAALEAALDWLRAEARSRERRAPRPAPPATPARAPR